MLYLAALVAIACFVIAFDRLGIVAVAASAIALSREATATIRDRSLTDFDKETMVRKASLQLLGSFVSILIRGGVAIGASLLPLFAFDLLGVAPIKDVASLLMTWQTVVGVSAAMAVVYCVNRRL